jgi:hypothetical protein
MVFFLKRLREYSFFLLNPNPYSNIKKMARLFEVEQAPLMPCNEDFKVDPDHKM